MSIQKLIAVAMLVWGNLAFASLPTSGVESRQELQTISSFMAFLNTNYSNVNVRVQGDLSSPESREEALEELTTLESYLRGEVQVPAAPLVMLACTKAICDKTGGAGPF